MCQEIFGLNFIARSVDHPWEAYSDCFFMDRTLYHKNEGIYAILVIRLKQSNRLPLIRPGGGCVNTPSVLEFIYSLLLETKKFL